MSEGPYTLTAGGVHGPASALDSLLARLDSRRRSRVEPLLRAFHASGSVVGLLVFGSLVSGRFDPDSDVDMVVVTRHGELEAAERIIDRCFPAETTLFRGATSRHEWFGHLTSVWCAEPFLFGIDIGVVDRTKLGFLHVAPGAALLKDTGGCLAERMAATGGESARLRECDLAEEPYRLFSLLIKIRKALRRGHLWNAIDYVAHLRRIYMQGLREAAGLCEVLQRPERGLEDVLPGPMLCTLEYTLPSYDPESVCAAAGELVEQIIALRGSAWSEEIREGLAVALQALRSTGQFGRA